MFKRILLCNEQFQIWIVSLRSYLCIDMYERAMAASVARLGGCAWGWTLTLLRMPARWCRNNCSIGFSANSISCSAPVCKDRSAGRDSRVFWRENIRNDDATWEVVYLERQRDIAGNFLSLACNYYLTGLLRSDVLVELSEVVHLKVSRYSFKPTPLIKCNLFV